MDYALVEVRSNADWKDYHALRREVLWERRGRRDYDETHEDEHDPTHHPLLLKLEGRAIGTVRLDDFGNGTGAIRLVAIAPDLQRKGHGRILSEYVEAHARALGISTLYVNSAPDAVGFYERLGWQPKTRNGITERSRQMSKVF